MVFITFLITLMIDVATSVAIAMSEIGKVILPMVFSGFKSMLTFAFRKRK